MGLKSSRKKRIVIKIGTNLILDKGIRHDNIKQLTDSIASIKNYEVILVSSGAVGLGRSSLNAKLKHEDDIMRNVCASVGQIQLIELFKSAFSSYNINTGQILLTQNEIANRESFLRIKELLSEMVKNNIIPIINENDSIHGPHNKFRDNDDLAIKIASKIEADLLIILTNVDGVYKKDPKAYSDAELIENLGIEDIKDIQMGRKTNGFSTGGMESKLKTALLSSELGIKTVIANGNEDNVIKKIIDGVKLGTSISAQEKMESKKRWILLTKKKGSITIDEGAFKALKNNKSLLAIGIISAEGSFMANDVIAVKFKDKIIGKTITECASDLLQFIIGKNTEEVKKVLKDYKGVAKQENIVLVGDAR